MHQGDQDGRRGVYHINAVDQVTQREIVATTPQISECWLLPVLEALLGQFPFTIRAFHAGNGLVESNNGAIIRKHIGFGCIDAQYAEAAGQFHRQHRNPYVNFHRPRAVSKIVTDANGKRSYIWRFASHVPRSRHRGEVPLPPPGPNSLPPAIRARAGVRKQMVSASAAPLSFQLFGQENIVRRLPGHIPVIRRDLEALDHGKGKPQ